MALQGSGQIKLSEIATEFGGTEPHNMSEYYAAAAGVPASGQLSSSDFYGTSNVTYTAATGGTITTDGDYKVHTFTGSGTFNVSYVGTDTTADYLVIAGGGPGGCYSGGAGGGAGGYRTSFSTSGGGCSTESSATLSTGAHTVTIGAGGVWSSGFCPLPSSWWPGSDSSALGVTSTGGGGAGGEYWAGREVGGPGGSGGGGCGGGGAGTSCQGYSGGTGCNAGGGGAGSAPSGSTGGSGLSSSITGSSTNRAWGGSGSGGAAGPGNTGSGGSGSQGSGGSGIVVIRYKFQNQEVTMAHFAKLEEGVVTQVIVVDNSDILDEQGQESEALGIQFCNSIIPGTWVQTSYNGTFRKNFAGLGHTYDASRNAFIAEKPEASWVLNEDTCRWEAPTPYPTDGNEYRWDEATLGWVQS